MICKPVVVVIAVAGCGRLNFDPSAIASRCDPPRVAARTTADLTGDGIDDLVVGAFLSDSSSPTDRIWIFAGGDGLASGSAPTRAYAEIVGGGTSATALHNHPLSVIDWNGDGFADLVFGSDTPMVVALGPLAAGAHDVGSLIGPRINFPNLPASRDTPSAVILADFTGDGVRDAALAAYTNHLGTSTWDGMLAIYADAGALNGDVATPLEIVPATADTSFGTAMVAGDIDHDGVPELFVAAPTDSVTGIANGSGYLFAAPFSAGSAEAVATRRVSGSDPNEQAFGAIAMIDLDRDGTLDLVGGRPARNGGRGEVNVYSATGVTTIANPQMIGFGSRLAANLDLDGDGNRDLVVVGRDQLIGLTALDGEPPALTITDDRDIGWGGPLAVGDFNDDGYDDLAVGSRVVDRIGEVRIFFGGCPHSTTSGDADVVVTGIELDGGFGGALAARPF